MFLTKSSSRYQSLCVMSQIAMFAQAIAADKKLPVLEARKGRKKTVLQINMETILKATKVGQVFTMSQIIPKVCSPSRGEAAKELVALGYLVMTSKSKGPNPSIYRRIK